MTSPGWAIGVIRGGKLIFAKGYGLANLETQQPITPASNFRLASLTKPFTALAILQLVQSNKISLNDSIERYLNVSPLLGQVTIRQLLSHAGGIPDHEQLLLRQKNPLEPTTDDAIRILAPQYPLFSPGTKSFYSNAGYVLLAAIIESVTGLSYASYMRDSIFLPLGMDTSVVVDSPLVAIPNRVVGYNPSNERYEVYDYNRLNYIIGDEGIYSSIEDLAKWEQAWRTNALLSSRLRNLALTPTELSNGTRCKYGLGWLIGLWNGKRIMYHDGEWVGFRTIVLMLPPSTALTVIALSNVAVWNTEEDRLRIALIIADIISK